MTRSLIVWALNSVGTLAQSLLIGALFLAAFSGVTGFHPTAEPQPAEQSFELEVR